MPLPLSLRRSALTAPSGALGVYLLLGALVVFMSVGALLPAQLALLPGDDIRESLLQEKDIGKEDLLAFISSREAASIWVATGNVLGDKAMGELKMAQKAGVTSDEGKIYLQAALQDQKKALARAPASPYDWVRLSYLLWISNGPSKEVVSALSRSFKADPYESTLLWVRLEMAVNLWDLLDPETKAFMPSYIQAFWSTHPQKLAYFALEKHAIGLIENALSSKPDALRQFNATLDDIAKKKDE